MFDTLNDGDAGQPVASVTTRANLVQRLDRRLNQRAGAVLGAQGGIAASTIDARMLQQFEKALHDLASAELNPFGIEVRRMTLLLGTTPQQKLDYERRRLELETRRAEMLAKADRIEKNRQLEVEKGRREREHDLTRMGLVLEHDLWLLEHEGTRERNEAERQEGRRQLESDLLIGRQKHAAQLEMQLRGARNDMDVERLRMQLEREKLDIARIAQDQNLRSLERIKQIERDDELTREKATFANVAGVSSEQALIALLKGNPNASEALKAKFSAEAQVKAAEAAARGSQDQVKVVQENQAQMVEVMKSALQAAGGAPIESPCPGCGKAVKATFKVCPYCGAGLAKG